MTTMTICIGDVMKSEQREEPFGPEEWQDQLKSLQQWVCELLITNQQLRMALESTMAQEKREEQDG